MQQRDGSSITFRQVVVPQKAQPVAMVPATALTAVEEVALSQMPVKEAKVLSISASVHADGATVVRWTCGGSQRLQAVSHVDFRYLAGLGNLETEHASYFVILSAGTTDQGMSETETLALQSLPVNGRASVALLSGSAAPGTENAAALDAMNGLMEYFDAHREELVMLRAQREARELAQRNEPPPPPRHSVVHFWPLQPEQRAAINAQTQSEAALKAAAQQEAQRLKGGAER